ncbi:MAG: Crl family RNA polymerase assembly factor [Psychromonas sp.]|nr:Crl family RNA polymerase assembly factor [Psychromonas sp.]
MTTTQIKSPTRKIIFQMFTDLGPYFRPLRSTETSFFFDSLEICLDIKKEPVLRTFYGWSLVLSKNELHYNTIRFDGLFNIESEWVNVHISDANQKIINRSFNLFITRLQTLLTDELGLSADELNLFPTEIKSSKQSTPEPIL